MKILLVCSGGMSTSLIVEAMKKQADVRGIPCQIEAIPLSSLAAEIHASSCVLVAPQVRHRLKSVEELAKNAGKPVTVIDSTAYGRVDGKAVLNQALLLKGVGDRSLQDQSPTDLK